VRLVGYLKRKLNYPYLLLYSGCRTEKMYNQQLIPPVLLTMNTCCIKRLPSNEI